VYGAQQGENQGAFARPNLLDIAETAGVGGDDFEACLDDRAIRVAVLDDTASGIRQAVGATPTIDVNGTRFTSVPPLADLRAAIDAALAGAPPEPLPSRPPIQDPWAELPVDGRTVGDPDAPVTVDLWIDYQGLNGPVLARELAPELRSRVAAGEIRLVLHDLAYLGQESVFASSTVRCIEAQGGPHWLVSDVLAAAGSGPDNQVFVPDTLLRLASQLGLDVKSFDFCMQDPATLAMIEADTEAGRAIGLQSGPAVVIVSGGLEAARFEGSLVASSVLAAIDELTP
jgi:protein-disulfide isomerase